MSLRWADFPAGVQVTPGASSTGPYLDFTPLVMCGKRLMAYLTNAGSIIMIDPATNSTVKTITVPNILGSGTFAAVGMTFDGRNFWISVTDAGGGAPDLIMHIDQDGNYLNNLIVSNLSITLGLQGTMRQLTHNGRYLYQIQWDGIGGGGSGGYVEIYDPVSGAMVRQIPGLDEYAGITFDHNHFYLVNIDFNVIDMWEGPMVWRMKQMTNPDGLTYSNGIACWDRYLIIQQS